MTNQKKIFAISGSLRQDSANGKLLKTLTDWSADTFEMTVFDGLSTLPHFDPGLSTEDAPEAVLSFRRQIAEADGLLICTPEYVFSLPGSLKNALEWLVSTVILTDKPTGLITASASGEKGHEQLELIMRTLQANFTPQTQLLIKGIKGKFDAEGQLQDAATEARLRQFLHDFKALVEAGPVETTGFHQANQ